MSFQLGASGGQVARRAPRRLQRVLMTVDSVGGVWRYALDLSKSLHERGVSVALIGFGPGPSRAQRLEAEAARVPMTWDDAPLDWMPGGIARLADARAAIARAAKAFKADLVHVNTLAYATEEFAPLPVVAVAHSCVPTWWRAMRACDMPAQWEAHFRANKAGLQKATKVITPSRSHAQDLRAVYGAHPNVSVVYNASADATPMRRKREQLVFAAGRWWDEAKNARVLDRAARMTRWPIVMAGSLHDPSGPQQMIAHARAIGPLDGGATREWMRRAAIFAAPSVYEPFGLAVLEAARASTPLVLADIPTFRELWAGAALFASPADPAEFARAIDTLMDDAAMRRKLAMRARARAAAFTLARQADAMLAAYHDAIGADADARMRGAAS